MGGGGGGNVELQCGELWRRSIMGTFSHSRMTRIGWGVFGSQLSQFLPLCNVFQIMGSVLLMVHMLTVGSTQQEVSESFSGRM